MARGFLNCRSGRWFGLVLFVFFLCCSHFSFYLWLFLCQIWAYVELLAQRSLSEARIWRAGSEPQSTSVRASTPGGQQWGPLHQPGSGGSQWSPGQRRDPGAWGGEDDVTDIYLPKPVGGFVLFQTCEGREGKGWGGRPAVYYNLIWECNPHYVFINTYFKYYDEISVSQMI